jgi:predicted nucleotidyltransferase
MDNKSMSQLGNALFTTTQQRVLSLLYAHPDKSFYTREILRLTGMGVATIKRELDRMVAAGILGMTRIGNQHHYQANPECPIYHELLGIVKKTFGMTDVIREALAPLADRITWAFIFGSVASGKETSASDIDVMIIGDVGFSEVVAELFNAQQSLAREINPKIFSEKEWVQRCNAGDSFTKDLLAKPRMDVMGGANEPGQFAGNIAGED